MTLRFTVHSPSHLVVDKYPALQHVPFILDSNSGYHRLANRYLIERGTGVWTCQSNHNSVSVMRPSPRTLYSYAEWIANFLEWCETRGVDIATCTYRTHALEYQREMIEGSWSRTGKGLSPKTANLRTQHACDFLTWLSQKGNRLEFSVPYTEKTVSRTTVTNDEVKFSKTVRIRGGQATDAFPKPLILPEHEEVEHWLKEVYQKDGTTFGLICETILCTAMRREEVASLRIDTLPLRRDEWKIVNPKEPDDLQQVRVAIRYGTKGRWSGQDHGDKIGPERHILMPLRLALLWDQYRNDTRNRSINALISHIPDARLRANAVKAAVHLFLRERDGKRFDGAEIYRRWNKIRIGKKNWTPHLGRHWWACSVLWNSLVTHPAISDIKKAKDNQLREHGQTIIKLIIQPQLGHRSESTTFIYLQWLMTKLSRPIVFARR